MEQWGGFCCIGAAALYLLSRLTARDVDFLRSVTRVDQLKDLESSRVVLPSIIAVSGIVGSESPIKSDHGGILGVILQETEEQQFLKRNWKFSWVQDTALMLPVCKEVPWFLDDGTGRVIVEGAQSAIGFALTPGGEVLEKPEPSSLVRGTFDYLRGLKMLGIRRVERVLPIGTPLTVVGQTIKDGVGDVKIQKPDQGPFYVSPLPLDQLISKVGEWSRRFKKASIAAKRKEQGREEEGVENSRDSDAPDLCVVCLERKCNAAFDPCGHMCCCLTCSLKLLGKPCPLCRKRGYRILKLYRN